MIRTSLYPACSSLFFTCAGFVAQVSPCDELSAKASCGKVREITAIAMIPSILCIGALRVVECPPNELDDQVNVPLRRKVLCGIVERKRRDASAHAICSPHTLVGKGFDETRYFGPDSASKVRQTLSRVMAAKTLVVEPRVLRGRGGGKSYPLRITTYRSCRRPPPARGWRSRCRNPRGGPAERAV